MIDLGMARGLENYWTEKFFKEHTKADLEKELLQPCEQCKGRGYNENWAPFNPGSDDQLKDVLYKGLGIYPRRYKGKVTVRYERLENIKNPPPLLPDEDPGGVTDELIAELKPLERSAVVVLISKLFHEPLYQTG